MAQPTSTHQHLPVETITITYDATHGVLRYDFENTNLANALQRLALAQMYMFADLQKQDTPPTEVNHEHV